ncbi:MAG: hypothetical protein HW390_44 [Candidatus Brocadiaceae bacterium]|nr:hypothetical protein [Candidatus Brocadiaceae bacterium]
MNSKAVDQLCKVINKHLHDLDRVLNGFIEFMPYFEFEKYLKFLVAEISKKNNLTRRNINILGEYYSMCQWLELEYKKWDIDNFESNPQYEEINSMYIEIYNSCNNEVLNFLKVYDSENIKEIRFDEEEPISITPYIQRVEKGAITWLKRIVERIIEAVSLKPGIGGISIDIKTLFRRNK